MYIITGSESADGLYSPFHKALTIDLKTHICKIVDLYPDSKLHIDDSTITNESRFPSNRGCFASTIHSHFLFISGGRNEHDDVLDDIWRLDLKTLEWKMLDLVNFCNF